MATKGGNQKTRKADTMSLQQKSIPIRLRSGQAPTRTSSYTAMHLWPLISGRNPSMPQPCKPGSAHR